MAEKESRAKSAMSGGKKSGKKKDSKKSGKKVKEMHIRHAANGGYVIKHDMAHDAGEMPGPDEDQPHVAGDMDQLLSHVQDHMQPPQESEPQSPAPQPGASAPNPMAMMGGGGQ